jgi:hypothetical protein
MLLKYVGKVSDFHYLNREIKGTRNNAWEEEEKEHWPEDNLAEYHNHHFCCFL